MNQTKDQIVPVTARLPAGDLETIKRHMLDAGERNTSDANAVAWAIRRYVQKKSRVKPRD